MKSLAAICLFFILLAALFFGVCRAAEPTAASVSWTDNTTVTQLAPFSAAQRQAIDTLFPPQVRPPTQPSTQPTLYTGTKGWRLPLDTAGWIAWPKADAEVFVDVVAGNDANPGTAAKPFKTVKQAGKILPKDKPFCLWLKSNQSFGALPDLPVGKPDRPNLVRAWGTGRADVGPISLMGKTGLAFIDLRTTGPGNSTTTGFFAWNSARIVLEGCEVTLHRDGIDIEGDRMLADVVLYRCSIHNNFYDPKATIQHAQGAYFHMVRGLTVEGCDFDTNGWDPARKSWASIFNHNDYTTGDCDETIFRNNWSVNASATGAQLRAGGDVTYNVFSGNPIGLTYGLVNGGGPQFANGVTGEVGHNVFDGTRTIGTQVRGSAICLANIKGGWVHDNRILNGIRDLTSWAFSLEKGDGVFENDSIGIHDLVIEKNLTWAYPNGLRTEVDLKPGGQGKFSTSAIVLRGNALSSMSDANKNVRVDSAKPVAMMKGLDDFAKAKGFVDRAALLNAVRAQSRANWRTDLEAQAVVNWLETH